MDMVDDHSPEKLKETLDLVSGEGAVFTGHESERYLNYLANAARDVAARELIISSQLRSERDVF
jgi:acetylornithine/succinyldiaminopimelate/putrescine aminotransferase